MLNFTLTYSYILFINKIKWLHLSNFLCSLIKFKKCIIQF